MTAIDETSRRYLVDALHGQFPQTLLGSHVHQLTKGIADIVPVGNNSLLALGGATFVLFLLIFRS